MKHLDTLTTTVGCAGCSTLIVTVVSEISRHIECDRISREVERVIEELPERAATPSEISTDVIPATPSTSTKDKDYVPETSDESSSSDEAKSQKSNSNDECVEESAALEEEAVPIAVAKKVLKVAPSVQSKSLGKIIEGKKKTVVSECDSDVSIQVDDTKKQKITNVPSEDASTTSEEAKKRKRHRFEFLVEFFVELIVEHIVEHRKLVVGRHNR